MSSGVEGKRSRSEDSARSEEIQRQMQALTGRDLQLWSVSILIILVLGIGFLAMIFPNLHWHPGLWERI
jgi:hypothetical protein